MSLLVIILIGIGLKKFAETQEKLGEFKVTHDNNAVLKMHAPFVNIMDTIIADSTVSLLIEGLSINV